MGAIRFDAATMGKKIFAGLSIVQQQHLTCFQIRLNDHRRQPGYA